MTGDPFRIGQFGHRKVVPSSSGSARPSQPRKPILLLKPQRWDEAHNRAVNMFACVIGDYIHFPQHYDSECPGRDGNLGRMVPCVEGVDRCPFCNPVNGVPQDPRDYAYVPAVHLSATMRLRSIPSLCYLEFTPVFADTFIFGAKRFRGRIFNFHRLPNRRNPNDDGELVIEEMERSITDSELPEFNFNLVEKVKSLWLGTKYYSRPSPLLSGTSQPIQPIHNGHNGHSHPDTPPEGHS